MIERGIKEGCCDQINFKFQYVEDSVKFFIHFVTMQHVYQSREMVKEKKNQITESNPIAIYDGDSHSDWYSDDGNLGSWEETGSGTTIFLNYQVVSLKLIDNCDKDKKREIYLDFVGGILVGRHCGKIFQTFFMIM